MYDLCVKSGLIVNSDSKHKGNIYIKDGKISKITDGKEIKIESVKVIDASGKLVFPGFIDPHTHLNDPGLTESEDFYTGTCSAAAGGITTVIEHPLTFPLPNNKKDFLDKKIIAESKVVTDFALFGACSPQNYADVKEIVEEGAVAFKAFLTYSPEIPSLNDMELYKHLMNLRDSNVLLAVHCENDDMTREFTNEKIKENKISFKNYNEARPEIAEIESVSKVALLAKHTKGKVHVVHCSSDIAINIVEDYKKEGTNITVETCPHYLYFNQEEAEGLGAFGICNPPIRPKEKVGQLRKCLKEGLIDFVGSDHATYTFDEKLSNGESVFDIPAGLSGIQTCFPVLFDEAVNKIGIDLEKFVELSSTNTARRFNIYPQKGKIGIASDADIVIFDPNLKWDVDVEQFFYKQKWTPYEGRKIEGRVETTIVRGSVVYDGVNIVVDKGYGKFVRPSKSK